MHSNISILHMFFLAKYLINILIYKAINTLWLNFGDVQSYKKNIHSKLKAISSQIYFLLKKNSLKQFISYSQVCICMSFTVCVWWKFLKVFGKKIQDQGLFFLHYYFMLYVQLLLYLLTTKFSFIFIAFKFKFKYFYIYVQIVDCQVENFRFAKKLCLNKQQNRKTCKIFLHIRGWWSIFLHVNDCIFFLQH